MMSATTGGPKYMTKLKKVGSLLVVPLVSHQNLIGILYATKEMDFGFDQDDIEVLSGFADQVTIAIENATLIQRSLEKERLQRELLLAQEMQKRLLPQTLPTFPNVEMQAVSAPALEVGGDYYDIAIPGRPPCRHRHRRCFRQRCRRSFLHGRNERHFPIAEQNLFISQGVSHKSKSIADLQH